MSDGTGDGTAASAADEATDGAVDDDSPGSRLPRRALLGGVALLGAGAAGFAALGGEDDGDGSNDGGDGGSRPSTTPVDDDTARGLAERFAPTLYFDRFEKWFPTDPRRYATEDGERTVVSGFDALDGYTREARSGSPPAPTVFYHAVSYGSVTVVDYWFYSAFDQFTTNFHWHDWEVLHVVVDTSEAEPEPVLYVASAHSTSVPNNEYLDPPDRPAIISEVGSHSSALGVNERRDSFQRLPVDGLPPDVTNAALSVAPGDGIPLAYGLPRDEGFGLPFAVPELDGAPVSDHPRLPNVEQSDLLAADLTVRSFADLARPPSDLPRRETGLSFGYDEGDESYDLVAMRELDAIDAFTGPQLSFEFAVPGFVEDGIADHLTGPDAPWTQDRFTDPLSDVTDDDHRAALRERFGLETGGDGRDLVGRVRELRESTAVDGERGVALTTPRVEAVTLLESDPVATPTFRGVVAHVDVPDGEHRLTVNAPGVAPYAQRVRVGSGGGDGSGAADGGDGRDTATSRTTRPGSTTATDDESTGGPVRLGAGGTVAVVANENAVKLEVDAADRGGARRVQVTDDVGGRVYDAPPTQTDGRGAVYVHRAGAYAVEVTDERGRRSVERVTPDEATAPVTVGTGATGKASITSFLVEFLESTQRTVQRVLERGGGPVAGGSGPPEADAAGDGTNGQATSAGDDATRTPAGAAAEDVADAPDDGETGDDETDDGDAAAGTDEDSTAVPSATPTLTPDSTPTPDGTSTPTDPVSTPDSTVTTDAGQTLRQLVTDLLGAAVDAAAAANELAAGGRGAAADEKLRAVRGRLAQLSAVLDRASARLPQGAVRVARNRLERADARAEEAIETPL